MNFLFLFLDGIGLAEGNPEWNPFARTEMPNLENLLGGHRLSGDSIQNGSLESERATLVAIDACLGVKGLPQSATGQSVLLTCINIPREIGYHYGPKPNPQVAGFLKKGTIFSELKNQHVSGVLLNAYPQSYFQAIESGRRLYSAIPQAVVNAQIPLKTTANLEAGDALAADFTAQGWHSHLKIPSIPLLTPEDAGYQLATLANRYQFSMFDFWLSDYAGHQQNMLQAQQLLTNFDQVMGALLSNWDDESGLILITSDHGNLEDLRTRRHTENPVPALVIGKPELRGKFLTGLKDLTGIAPNIKSFFQDEHPQS
jgi:2,3-bisphosphoglycerate-independent phosphoglycerate mutase